MRNCSNCGQINNDGQFACSRCGVQIAAPNNFGNAGQNQFGQNQPNFNQPMPQQVKKGMGCGKIALIGGGSLAVLGLIVAGIIGLLVTKTLQWKITEKWRMDSLTLAGTTTPMPSGKDVTAKFNWDQTYVVDAPNGKTERGTYRVVDEKTIAMTGGANNETVNFTTTIEGKTMTMTATKNNITVSTKYTQIE